jgi:hypothetical protein
MAPGSALRGNLSRRVRRCSGGRKPSSRVWVTRAPAAHSLWRTSVTRPPAFSKSIHAWAATARLRVGWTCPDSSSKRFGVAESQPPAKTGRRYTGLSGDLNGLASLMRSYGLGAAAIAGWLGRTALAQLRSRYHITWSWRDPVPALAVFAPIILAAGRRVLKLLRHRLRPSHMPSLGQSTQ